MKMVVYHLGFKLNDTKLNIIFQLWDLTGLWTNSLNQQKSYFWGGENYILMKDFEKK